MYHLKNVRGKHISKLYLSAILYRPGFAQWVLTKLFYWKHLCAAAGNEAVRNFKALNFESGP